VRHHFGSKDDLRKACDTYAPEAVHNYVDQAMTVKELNEPATIGDVWAPLHPFRRYLARALVDGSPALGSSSTSLWS
jgi:TetR/AcrR family transcriptional regulator, regulator of cefoperazone and chloramphenicol sensitivity